MAFEKSRLYIKMEYINLVLKLLKAYLSHDYVNFTSINSMLMKLLNTGYSKTTQHTPLLAET